MVGEGSGTMKEVKLRNDIVTVSYHNPYYEIKNHMTGEIVKCTLFSSVASIVQYMVEKCCLAGGEDKCDT